jgi:2-keto-4-pentenoate hydratase/2-oxohepta-3-ene-1,7-dioic acid hydratase in catechol pathway
MRYLTVEVDGIEHPGFEDDRGRWFLPDLAGTAGDLAALAPERLDALLDDALPLPGGAALGPPCRPGVVIAIGLNYMDHVRETGLEAPARPLVFAKLGSSVVGPGATIAADPAVTTQVDWEAELAVVIGRRTRSVAVADALGSVFAYTAANDVSARDVQFSDGQWVRGKSLDTFCPLGPVLVSADAFGDPQAKAVRTLVNGELVQDSNTREMVFGVAELIAFCSHSFTLRPGDVILTGTPWGCGGFMDPPRFLADGDVVEVEVEDVGLLRNPVRIAPGVG